jgi:Protein of unknown function (DUF3617)
MLTRSCSFRMGARTFAIGAMAVNLAVLLTVADAQELPSLRQGMWEFKRTVDVGPGKTQTITTKKCTNPTDDMKKQNDMLTKTGCTFSSPTKSGTSYRFTSQCTVQGVPMQSASVISVDSDSAYRVDVDLQAGGQKTKEQLIARRIGDC